MTKEVHEIDQWALNCSTVLSRVVCSYIQSMIYDSNKNIYINIQVKITVFPYSGGGATSSFTSVNLACSWGFPFLWSAVCWRDWKLSRGCFHISLQCCFSALSGGCAMMPSVGLLHRAEMLKRITSQCFVFWFLWVPVFWQIHEKGSTEGGLNRLQST